MEKLKSYADKWNTPVVTLAFRMFLAFWAFVAAMGVWTFQTWFDEKVEHAPAIVDLTEQSNDTAIHVAQLTRLVEQLAVDNQRDREKVGEVQASIRFLSDQREGLRVDLVKLEASVAENTRNAKRVEAKIDKLLERE